jgi:hypothetical protein
VAVAAAPGQPSPAEASELSLEDEELAEDSELLELAGGDSTSAGVVRLLRESGGDQPLSPKTAEVASALADIERLAASEREVLASSAKLLAKLGVKQAESLFSPPPPTEEEDDGGEEEEESAE